MASQSSPSGNPVSAAPGSQPAMDLSITALAQKIVDSFPATELIKVLLQYVAIDTANFGRDVQTSAQVYSRSLVVYNAIQELMKKVADSTTIDFLSFDKYTTAISPLESILLDFYLNYPEDKTRGLLPPTDDVVTSLLFIDIWESDRQMLAKTLNDLKSEAFTSLSNDAASHLQASYLENRNADDIQMLRGLYTYFGNNKLKDRDIVNPRNAKLLSSVKTTIRQMATAVTRIPYEETTAAMVIKTMLISYIPFALLLPEVALPEKWKTYLSSTNIWQALESLVKRVASFVEAPSQGRPSLDELEKEWQRFKELLLKLADTVISTLEEMLDLLKLGANIRQPLHGRSVQLIRMLFFLDNHSQDAKNNATRHRNDLKLLMGESIEALGHAKEAVKDVKAITLTDEEYKEQDTELRTILSKIGELFGQIGIPGEWLERERSYNELVKADEARLISMRKRLNLSAAGSPE